jgi:hypothetical protein
MHIFDPSSVRKTLSTNVTWIFISPDLYAYICCQIVYANICPQITYLYICSHAVESVQRNNVRIINTNENKLE